MHATVLLSINQRMKFEVPSFTYSKAMIGVPSIASSGKNSMSKLRFEIFALDIIPTKAV